MAYMSIAEILNPADWRRHREHQDRIQIEGYKFQQREAHHQDQMNAIGRRADLDERRVSGSLAIDRERLEFDKQNAARSHEVALRTAEVQGQYALELARQNNAHALDAMNAQAHADLVKAAGLLPVLSAESAFRRGEDQNRAISGALADAFRAKINQKMAEKLEDQKERHRSNERRHEVRMAILKARLDERGFTHEEITKLIIRLVDPTTSNGDKDDEMLFHKYQEWYNDFRI